ncbi:MAG: bacteriohemerythrin [Candidatus Electryonea clarkiae]|nr:bacteriohemerythrin [Candidatus Electryonea clarkiae]MDP8286801.1 bacteriohemerythrin [Candidatus Electryonea clarkiae]
MPFLPWMDEYSVGVGVFDEQHKKMFGFIVCLEEAINEIQEHAVLRQIVHDLILYTKDHFRDEEYNMYIHNYPDYIEHKHEHEVLTSDVIKYALDFCTNPNLSIEILSFLGDWVINHILDSDKKYTEFFAEKEIIVPE